MRSPIRLFIAFCLTANAFAEVSLPPACRQVVCVTAPSWSSNAATLQRWERTESRTAWKKVGDPADVRVGKNGMGWGLGLHGTATGDGPAKKEGDRKAPAGVFRLPTSFGTSAQPAGKLPWQKITPTLEAVDDPSSRYYNQIVDRQQIGKPDWKSSEKMAKIPVYALGVVVAHNPKNIPGSGSCIFIHLREGGSGTAGCTALKESDMVSLLRWLDPAQEPVLIQFPQEIMQREWPRE